jgi:hypothetical protein
MADAHQGKHNSMGSWNRFRRGLGRMMAGVLWFHTEDGWIYYVILGGYVAVVSVATGGFHSSPAASCCWTERLCFWSCCIAGAHGAGGLVSHSCESRPTTDTCAVTERSSRVPSTAGLGRP